MASLNDTKAGMEGQLSGLFAQMGGKVDSLWLDDLERQLRLEIDKLARQGRNAVDNEALEAKLAALRQAMEDELSKAEDEASGAAAFKCLLCDRPLPPKEDWRMKSRKDLSTSIPHNHEEVSGEVDADRAAFQFPPTDSADFDPGVVYRAGFPTVGSRGQFSFAKEAGVSMSELPFQEQQRPSSVGSNGYGAWGQRGGGRNLPPVDASGRPIEVLRSGRGGQGKWSSSTRKPGAGLGNLTSSRLDGQSLKLDQQGPALPVRFNPILIRF